MRRKYIEERFPQLMQFGRTADGQVGVTDELDTLDVVLPPKVAAQVIAHHNKVVDALVALALAFNAAAPEAFDQHWYGPRAAPPDQTDPSCA